MTSSLYWLEHSLAVLPALLLTYISAGFPVALLLLPRRDWSERSSIAVLTLISGSALLTLWMFIIGTIGAAQNMPLMNLTNTLIGIAIIAGVAWLLLFYKRRHSEKPDTAPIRTPFAFDEKLLIACIGLALLVRFITTAYWTFTAYDPLWVFAYNARLFVLNEFIPADIAYYPQYLALQYTFAQFLAGGIDDHAARMVIPILHIGSILTAYIAGKQLFNRRTGLFTAAIWALYPHVADWARIGDLEIPLTFLMTACMAFFLTAWLNPEHSYRRRYALIAGLIFGVAMWTKPTAGAFIWGVILLVGLDLLRVRFNLLRWRPRFEIALITGLACIPHGVIWYLRNLALGHNIIDLPHVSWIGLARRSGDLFGWVLLALILLLIYLHTRQQKPDARLTVPGMLFILAGILPSTPYLYEVVPMLAPFTRPDPPQSYLQPVEVAFIITGCLLIGTALWRYARNTEICIEETPPAIKFFWLYALILPYFLTWFYSYSYHYRLVFAITPMLIVPVAWLLSRLLPAAHIRTFKPPIKFAYIIVIIGFAVPGIFLPYFSADRHDDWLWTDRYPDDWSRYTVHNADMILLSEQLIGYRDFTGINPIILAPGEQRLPFFFSELKIDNTSLLTTLDELSDHNVTHFIYGTQAAWRYADANIAPEDNQIVAAMGRRDLMEQPLFFDEGTFRYELYQFNHEIRSDNPAIDTLYIPEEIILYDDFARLRAYNNVLGSEQLSGNRAFFTFLWESISPTTQDYNLQIRLVLLEDEQVYHTWTRNIAAHMHGHYRTSLWQPGEQILDKFSFQLDETDVLPQGEYRVEYWLCQADNPDTCADITIDDNPVDFYAIPITWRYR